MTTGKKMRIGIIGSSGRMGQEVHAAAKASGHKIVIELNSKNFSSFLKNKNNAEVDVWVDFSKPNVLEAFLEQASKNPVPIVSGTTGLTSEHMNQLKKYSKKAPVFWSPNMSVGVALVAKMFEVFSFFPEFDFQIDETHHKHKKDKPSGTAIFLQEKLSAVLGKRNLPGPLSIRGGGVFGIHRLQAFSEEEVISIEHVALNRKVFAKGALWAAQWVMQYKSGFFEMKDLFKI